MKIEEKQNIKLYDYEKECLWAAISKTRVNIKSLAAESKFIREEIKKCNSEYLKGILNTHRIDNVRREARAAQLTLACLKGKPYSKVETNAKYPPDWSRIKNKLGRHYMTTKAKNKIEEWLKESINYFEKGVC